MKLSGSARRTSRSMTVKSYAGCAGKSITKAIAKANEKYPTEALQVNNDNLADVQAHYEYLADHEAIYEKLNALKR